MKLGEFKLSRGCSERGADMGRTTFLPANRNISIKLRLIRLDLDSSGYDKGGAYWGLRDRGISLFWAESVENFPVEYGFFGEFIQCEEEDKVQISLDASSREEEKSKIKDILPNATFFR
jgi:hypothetical protein